MSEYYDLSILKKYDIIGEYRYSLLSRIIWFFSTFRMKGEEYERKLNRRTAHVRLYLGDNECIHVSWEGIVKVSLPKYSKKKYQVNVCRVNKPFSEDRLQAIVNSEYHLKPDYDFARLFIIAIRKLFKIHRVDDFRKDAMICSEFITDVFYDVGIDFMPGINSCDVTPIDVMTSNVVDIVEL